MANNQITYAKLNSDEWGLRGPNLVAGAVVTVTKKSGETQTETVSRVIWRGNGVALATIAATQRSDSYSRRNKGGNVREIYRHKYGWNGVEGYYTSGLYDEES